MGFFPVRFPKLRRGGGGEEGEESREGLLFHWRTEGPALRRELCVSRSLALRSHSHHTQCVARPASFDRALRHEVDIASILQIHKLRLRAVK